MAVVYDLEIDQGADWFVNFQYNQPAEITNITSNGTAVTFVCANAFNAGQSVSISGVLPSQYNFQNVTIATASTTQFTVTNPATGTYISGGLAYSPVNVSNYTAALQIRSLPSSETAVLSLTNGNGITVGTTNGLIEVHATAIQTAAIDEGPYYYDIEITSPASGTKTRLAQGRVIVNPEVTR